MYYRKVRLRITAAVGTFVSLASMNFGIVPSSTNAQSLSRPYVILVNGYEDCCVYDSSSRGIYMEAVYKELERSGAEFRLVPWDGFEDGGKQKGRTSNDAAFLSEAADFINNKLDPDRPLVMIGHSFGGDSLLSLAPRISRRIQFLGVIDPVAAGGLRQPVTGRGVPSNVDYFFNRWQRNGLSSSNVVPFDSRVVNGSISNCQAKTCDQEEQNLSRNSDGSEIRVSCGRLEVSCPGYEPWPGGSNGTKAKRLAHNDMPLDNLIQSQIAANAQSAVKISSTSLRGQSDRIDPRTAYHGYRLNQVSALDQVGDNFAFSALPNGDLLAIKKSGTASGHVEVHILTAESNYTRYRLNQVSALDQVGDNFAFSALPNGDLLAIKKSGTASGHVEVHILTAESNYTRYRLNQVSVLDQIGDNFAFSALPNGDLLAIKKSGTASGHVEVHVLTAASNYTRYRLNQVSALDQIGDNFAFSALPNGDLLAIKKSGTTSGHVEVHILTAESNYTRYRLNQVSALDQVGDNFAFSVLPTGDLLAIKKSGTASGNVEVHILTAR